MPAEETREDSQPLEQLLEVARRQTLAAFEQEVRAGTRDPATEIAIYQRRLRDYRTWLRLEQAPDEVRELAAKLLADHGFAPSPDTRHEFELSVTRMLAALYVDFLKRSEKT